MPPVHPMEEIMWKLILQLLPHVLIDKEEWDRIYAPYGGTANPESLCDIDRPLFDSLPYHATAQQRERAQAGIDLLAAVYAFKYGRNSIGEERLEIGRGIIEMLKGADTPSLKRALNELGRYLL